MAKSQIYFLSLIFFLLASCSKQKELAEFPQRLKIQQLQAQNKHYYQGSIFGQEIYDQLIEIAPEIEAFYRNKSIPHSKIGDYHLAVPLLEKSISLDAKESLYYCSWLFLNLYHDYERALDYLNQYDDFTPGQKSYAWGENVYQLKGLAYKGLKRYEEAIEAFSMAIESEGDYPDTYSFVYRGISYSALGNSQKAINDFDKAIALYDKASMAYFYKGVVLWEQKKDKEGAIKEFNQAKKLLAQGYKLTDPYKEVFDEVHIEMVDDYLKSIK